MEGIGIKQTIGIKQRHFLPLSVLYSPSGASGGELEQKRTINQTRAMSEDTDNSGFTNVSVFFLFFFASEGRGRLGIAWELGNSGLQNCSEYRNATCSRDLLSRLDQRKLADVPPNFHKRTEASCFSLGGCWR